MTLNPLTVVDQVLGEYRSYLSTEFQARAGSNGSRRWRTAWRPW